VTIEANKGMGVGVYDEKGAMSWSYYIEISTHMFIFEAPLELQQSALMADLINTLSMLSKKYIIILY
jgi:hypothetical protein